MQSSKAVVDMSQTTFAMVARKSSFVPDEYSNI